ncbi:MAG TPA: aminotransferase class IV [Clostridia bacterium]|nr:aminotransferase class IV [Clostridia bacterium]
MSSEIIEDYVITNGRIVSASEVGALSAGSSKTIYEVIRVLSGVPLFLERHLKRLEASARLTGCTVGSIADNVESSIHKLIKANDSPNKNIKIIVYNLENILPDYMAYFIQSNYPAADEYKRGVPAILFNEERSNPNAKVVNLSFKEKVADALSSAKAYEALLVNRENQVTEGSRSNVFFVKNGIVYTAPKGSVLIGITRVCVFELCEKLAIEIVEEPINASMLGDMDGVFMTGTSPKLLPISTIDDMHFDSADNQVIKALMKGYDEMLQEYIRGKRG